VQQRGSVNFARLRTSILQALVSSFHHSGRPKLFCKAVWGWNWSHHRCTRHDDLEHHGSIRVLKRNPKAKARRQLGLHGSGAADSGCFGSHVYFARACCRRLCSGCVINASSAQHCSLSSNCNMCSSENPLRTACYVARLAFPTFF
jgi:hypothetical protein